MSDKGGKFDGNTVLEPYVTCPWCGCVDRDCWEMEAWDDNYECNDCERTFKAERVIDISYSTRRE